MASRAALAQNGGVGEGVGGRSDIVVAALAGGRDRGSRLGETAGAGNQRLGADVLHQVRAGQMALGAVAQVAREAEVLIIGGSQRVRVRQALTAVNAVDLHVEIRSEESRVGQ